MAQVAANCIYDGMLATLADHLLAHRLAESAGALLMRIRAKSDFTDVAALRALADVMSHQMLVAELAAERPSDAVLSEEAADTGARLYADRVWIIDPLDGTREFGEARRTDWAVHVALWSRGRLAAGAIALPALGKTLSSIFPVLMPVSGPPRVLVSRTRYPHYSAAVAELFGAELVKMGSAGAKTAAVVHGEATAYFHSGGQFEWDSAAPAAVAAASGLHVSRLNGSALNYNEINPYLPDFIVCRPSDASTLLRLIRQRRGL